MCPNHSVWRMGIRRWQTLVLTIDNLLKCKRRCSRKSAKYPGITNHVAMPFPDFSLKSGNKQVAALQNTAWMKKRRVVHKFTTGWEVGHVHSKKTTRKTKKSVDNAIDDEHIEWWVKYAPTEGRRRRRRRRKVYSKLTR